MSYVDSLQVIEECQKKITASPNLPYVVGELKALSNAKVDLSICVIFCKTCKFSLLLSTTV